MHTEAGMQKILLNGSTCGTSEVGINYFLAVRIQVDKHS